MVGTLSSKYWHQLNEPPENLADLLKKYGYRNSFLLSGDHLNFFGIRRVFGSNIDLFRDGSMEHKKYANDDRSVLSWLHEYNWKSAGHTFLYIHLMSAHIIGFRDPRFKKWLPDKEWNIPKLFYSHRAYRNNYHNGILQADNTIKQIFEVLEQQGMLERALVVITADHGEFLGESDNFGHGYKPYEPMVRIPLLVYDGLQSNYPERSISSQVDIAPTMLYAIGAEIPKDWSGIPLQLPTLRSAVYIASYDVSGVVADLNGHLFKYMRNRKDGNEMLFDLYGANAEAVNLAEQAEAKQTLATMRKLNK
jgi:arylsulfatase A-like enzyme